MRVGKKIKNGKLITAIFCLAKKRGNRKKTVKILATSRRAENISRAENHYGRRWKWMKIRIKFPLNKTSLGEEKLSSVIYHRNACLGVAHCPRASRSNCDQIFQGNLSGNCWKNLFRVWQKCGNFLTSSHWWEYIFRQFLIVRFQKKKFCNIIIFIQYRFRSIIKKFIYF